MKKLFFASILAFCMSSLAGARGADVTITPRLEGLMFKPKAEAAEWSFGATSLYGFIDGDISDSFSYSASLHFYSYGAEEYLYKYEMPFVTGTPVDWAYISYDGGIFGFDAGKVVLNMGQFEFDERDVDCYLPVTSPLWNSTCVYQWGATARITPAEGQVFELQLTTSPWMDSFKKVNLAYSLSWRGEIGCYSSFWTFNRQHMTDGPVMNYIGLGNRFSFDAFDLTLDMSNGGAEKLSDFENAQYILRGKYTGSDLIHAELMGGLIFKNLPTYGLSINFFPFKDDTLRIFTSLSNTHYDKDYSEFNFCIGALYNINFHIGKK